MVRIWLSPSNEFLWLSPRASYQGADWCKSFYSKTPSTLPLGWLHVEKSSYVCFPWGSNCSNPYFSHVGFISQVLVEFLRILNLLKSTWITRKLHVAKLQNPKPPFAPNFWGPSYSVKAGPKCEQVIHYSVNTTGTSNFRDPNFGVRILDHAFIKKLTMWLWTELNVQPYLNPSLKGIINFRICRMMMSEAGPFVKKICQSLGRVPNIKRHGTFDPASWAVSGLNKTNINTRS